jgi:hypothetical protein
MLNCTRSLRPRLRMSRNREDEVFTAAGNSLSWETRPYFNHDVKSELGPLRGAEINVQFWDCVATTKFWGMQRNSQSAHVKFE